MAQADVLNPGLMVQRRPGELIMIEIPQQLGGGKIQISVIEIDRNTVRIGVNGPKSWNIYRGEIRDERLAPTQFKT